MAHTISALKRLRQSAARNAANRSVRSQVKTQIKKVQEALTAKDVKKAGDEFRLACKLLDKAVAKGVLHLNNAARRKSRLAAHLSAASAKKN